MVKFLEKISAWPEADAHMHHFELMIRAVSLEQMKTWLQEPGVQGMTTCGAAFPVGLREAPGLVKAEVAQ
eukprot:g3140.t1